MQTQFNNQTAFSEISQQPGAGATNNFDCFVQDDILHNESLGHWSDHDFFQDEPLANKSDNTYQPIDHHSNESALDIFSLSSSNGFVEKNKNIKHGEKDMKQRKCAESRNFRPVVEITPETTPELQQNQSQDIAAEVAKPNRAH